MYDFIIIGAGYAGLSAGALLGKAGKKVLVLEQGKRVGGRSHCIEKDGFIYQYGQHSHRLHKDGLAYQVFEELDDPLEFLEVKGKPYIYLDGKLYKRPEGLFGFLTTKALPFKARLNFLKFYMKLLKLEPDEWYDKTLLDCYQTWFDNPDVKRFISFLGFTIMLPDPDKVSAGEVIHFIKRAKQSKIKQGEPVGGAKQVLDKLVANLNKYGGELHLEEAATKIIVENKTAVGVQTTKSKYDAKNVVYACPVNNLFKIVEGSYFSNDFVNYAKNLESSSGVVIDFISKEPLSDIQGGILGVDLPLFVKFQTNIDTSIVPEGYHITTWGILTQPAQNPDDDPFEIAEKKLREAAAACIPGYKEKVVEERKLKIPVINANMLKPHQSFPHRPDIRSDAVNNLYLIGDTTRGDGCSGDISFSSAMKLYKLFT